MRSSRKRRFAFSGRKPCGIPIGLLWWLQPRDFTEMSLDDELFFCRLRGGSRSISPVAALATNVPGKRGLFHPSVSSGLLESFEGCRLGVRQSRFSFALRETSNVRYWSEPAGTQCRLRGPGSKQRRPVRNHGACEVATVEGISLQADTSADRPLVVKCDSTLSVASARIAAECMILSASG